MTNKEAWWKWKTKRLNCRGGGCESKHMNIQRLKSHIFADTRCESIKKWSFNLRFCRCASSRDSFGCVCVGVRMCVCAYVCVCVCWTYLIAE
jgi:hypothetical protein